MEERQRRVDPFADYIEWAAHRYDPGYYLGGNLPPHLRKGSLGRNGRRRAGILIGLMATGPTALFIATVFSRPWEAVVYAGFAILLWTAAARMYRAGAAPRS